MESRFEREVDGEGVRDMMHTHIRRYSAVDVKGTPTASEHSEHTLNMVSAKWAAREL